MVSLYWTWWGYANIDLKNKTSYEHKYHPKTWPNITSGHTNIFNSISYHWKYSNIISQNKHITIQILFVSVRNILIFILLFVCFQDIFFYLIKEFLSRRHAYSISFFLLRFSKTILLLDYFLWSSNSFCKLALVKFPQKPIACVHVLN